VAALLCDRCDLEVAAPAALKDTVAEIAHAGNNIRVLHPRLAFAAKRRRIVRRSYRSLSRPMHCNSPLNPSGSAAFSSLKKANGTAVIKGQWHSGNAATLRPRVFGKRLNFERRIEIALQKFKSEPANRPISGCVCLLF
jgi:hypothetical protein